MSTALEGHTVHSYDGELNHVHMLVIEMATLALDQTRQALYCFDEQDFIIADSIIEREHEVDIYEKKVDDELIALSARRAPVAKDLRVIMSLCKTVTDLERIGDEAAKIAHFTKEVFDNDRSDPSVHMLRDVMTMGNTVLEILHDAITALDTLNVDRAEAILQNHKDLDMEFQSSLRRLTTFIFEDSRNVGHVISIVLILKALERIGEHGQNIAENIIFIVKGQDVRHADSPVSLEA